MHHLSLFVKRAAALCATAASMFLSGCHQEPGEQTQPTPPPTKQKITFLGWADFISPEAIELFTKETGIEVEHVVTEYFEQVRAHLESNPDGFDVAIAEAGIITEWADLKLIQELDKNQLPLITNMDGHYMNLNTDPGNRYSIPVLSGTTIVAYRADKFTPQSESWKVLWDPAVKGKVGLLDDPREIFAVGLLSNGASLNATDDASLDKAEEDLVRLMSEWNVQLGGPFEILDQLSSGEIWATQCFSGDAALYAEKDPNIRIFLPAEGATQWVDNWVIPRDSRHVEAAHQFINFMMRPEIAAMTSNFSRYKSPNLAAFQLLDEKLRIDPVIFPPAELMARCEVIDPRNAARERRLQHGMANLMKARRELKTVAEAATVSQVP